MGEMLMDKNPETTKLKKRPLDGLLPSAIGFFLATVLLFADIWYVNTYGHINFDSILFTLTANLSGTSSSLFFLYLLEGLLPALVVSAGAVALARHLLRREKVKKWVIHTVMAALSVAMVVFAAFDSQLVDYLININGDFKIYESAYQDPDQTTVTFPEQKRNLVYILLESMETSFMSQELGGGVSENLIPELYELAKDNLNFSQSTGVGGFRPTTGATWTIGAMVSQTAGIPLAPVREDSDDEKIESDVDTLLPGATTLMDILHKNGYYQTLVVGSKAAFGDRSVYYRTHGVDEILDIETAYADGIVPEDYWDDWWGMEDYHLFDYAKQELTKLSQLDQPFAFTMLTVDTHHVDGHLCPNCGDEYEQQYDNVIRCSSRQVAAFVQWIQQQSFYENTTVVIVGDHCSMDADYFERNVDEAYVRRVYNCFLNAAIQTENAKNREFTTLDLFPTTLAALGCTIDGDRLGLGTNLFSGKQTLSELWGYETFCDRLFGNRDYYQTHFATEQE